MCEIDLQSLLGKEGDALARGEERKDRYDARGLLHKPDSMELDTMEYRRASLKVCYSTRIDVKGRKRRV